MSSQPRPDDARGTTDLRRSAILLILSSLNLVGGFLMQWYILARLGAGIQTDALFAGLALPQALLAIIASSFMNVLVPLLSGEDDRRFRRDAWGFAAVTLSLFTALALLLALLAPWWVPIVAPGLKSEGRVLTIHLARVQLIAMVCTSMAGVLWAVQRARRNFVWAECAPLVGTIVAWLLLVPSLPRWGVYAAAWIQVLRIGLHAALLVPGLGAFPGFAGVSETIREAWRRLKPLMLGTAYYRTEPLVDRALSSLAPPGDLSLYYLSQQVCQAMLQVANNALVSPLVPVLAEHAKQRRWPSFRSALRRGLLVVGGVALAGYLTLVLGGRLALAVLPLPPEAAFPRAWWLVAGLGGVLVGGPVIDALRSAFYATGNTAAPVRVDVSVFTLGLAMKVAGFLLLGVWGMALAASTQSLIGTLSLRHVLSRFLRRQVVPPSSDAVVPA